LSAAPPAAKEGIAKATIIAAMTNATANIKSMRLTTRYLPHCRTGLLSPAALANRASMRVRKTGATS
jgi:hypothetical protein